MALFPSVNNGPEGMTALASGETRVLVTQLKGSHAELQLGPGAHRLARQYPL